VWDGTNNRSVIMAIIRNAGSAPAPATVARVVDPSTPGPTGAPQTATVPTPPLAAGATTTVTFYLPYWVFNPDATLEVMADYKNELAECREDNNTRRYEVVG
jgi:subtilase family serine protease